MLPKMKKLIDLTSKTITLCCRLSKVLQFGIIFLVISKYMPDRFSRFSANILYLIVPSPPHMLNQLFEN